MAKATAPRKIDALPQVTIKSRADLRRWLAANGELSPGIWLVRYKKATGAAHVPYGDVVEECLCYGWIDSVARPLDADRSMILLTPRKPRSVWSGVNKERVARLLEAGAIQPAGLAKIEAAIEDGSWDALNTSDAGIIPPDLLKALKAHKGAGDAFNAFPPSSRRMILEWIYSAKRPETRADRVLKTAVAAAKSERVR